MTTALQSDAPATLVTPASPELGGGSLKRLVKCPSITHLDLFSGIGGFALAAQAAGFATIGFSEIEPYACKILKRHWRHVPNYGDIQNVRGVTADLITGGFPCQPYSLAGKRAGSKDDRALWPEMLRVIDEAKPSWVLGENVPGIITMELDRVLTNLENLGYSCWPIVIPACAADARHRRDRVWIVAHSESNERRRRLCEAGTEQNGNQPANCGAPVANTDQTGRREQCRAEPVEAEHPAAECGSQNVQDSIGIGQQSRSPSKPKRTSGRTLSGDAMWWPTEPELGRVADGIPDRSHRIRVLGNAIVPKIAEVLIREMARTLNTKLTHGATS